ncbi:uncharacterized protein LOC118436347 [Folsomia candida]|uniref:uncharacterized protein LOC118436347 n=1 Tax=Folsomia candida TaxID=158441 RepID=UPI0016055777|nr:uncharacterized protein LOC118436347 [Folsomia candida]
MMALLLRRPETYIIHRNKSLQIQILRSAFVTTLVVAALFAIVKFDSSNSQISEDTPPPGILGLSQTRKNDGAAKTKSSKIIILEGDAFSYLDLSVNDVLLQTENKPVDELILKYVTLSPEIFTEMLQTNPQIFQTLKSIKLERVKIRGASSPWNFTLGVNVRLPMLSDFQLDLDIGFRNQYTDYMKMISEEWLMRVLFYNTTDKSNPKRFKSNLGDKLVTDRVQVTIRVDGWTVISYRKSSKVNDGWEVSLGLTFADKLLRMLIRNNLKIVHLTMTECVVSVKSFPTSLQYLNLYRVNITGGDIHTFFKSATSLTDLYIELRNSTLNLSRIPKTVKTLAIGDVVDVQYDKQDYSVNAETVGLSFPLDGKIVENFETIFPNVKHIAAFEPPSNNRVQYTLLKNILKTNATWILMQGFERRNTTQFENEMEQVLQNCGVSPGQRNFLIFKDERTFSWNGMDLDLDKLAKLKFRYAILGWNEYISWDIFSTKL